HFGVEPELDSQFEIVGVVEDTKYRNPHEPVPPMYFLPMSQTAKFSHEDDQGYDQFSHYAGQVIVHFAGDPSNMAQQVRRAFNEIDPNLSISQIDTLRDELGTNLTQDILLSRLTLLFGGVALLLAAIGLYGVTAYAVARRTSEIGLRMALGANRLKVLQLVLHGAFLQVGIGLAIGVPAALLAARAMQSSLYGVHASNPTVLAATIAVLAMAALIAAFLPARRAASIDPMQALRTE
ncbi:MAG TPA: FtsX-like permease family protein, partial [Terriglobales bacterium]